MPIQLLIAASRVALSALACTAAILALYTRS
jgi:hypothetical protein